jgi:hypothetical protein
MKKPYPGSKSEGWAAIKNCRENVMCHVFGTWHNCCTETSQEVTHQTKIQEAIAITQRVLLQEPHKTKITASFMILSNMLRKNI